MTKLISDFKIESTTLEKKKDPNIEGIQNRVFVSTSFLTNSTREKLETLNIRLFISLDSDTSRITWSLDLARSPLISLTISCKVLWTPIKLI